MNILDLVISKNKSQYLENYIIYILPKWVMKKIKKINQFSS